MGTHGSFYYAYYFVTNFINKKIIHLFSYFLFNEFQGPFLKVTFDEYNTAFWQEFVIIILHIFAS